MKNFKFSTVQSFHGGFAKAADAIYLAGSFLRKCVSMTTFIIRGEPAVRREERRCADEITFVEVASTTAVPAGSRQSDPGGWMSMPLPSPPPPNPFSTRNRAIYRPSAGQPSLPFPRSKGGKSRVPRENRNGIEQRTARRGGGMARFPERRWPSVSL